jgi:hypothetical protein
VRRNEQARWWVVQAEVCARAFAPDCRLTGPEMTHHNLPLPFVQEEHCASALIQPNCLPKGNQTALATFGCPLGKLYSWAFPAYVNEGALSGLIHADGPGWANFYYPTDPIAGPVFHQERTPQVDVHLLDPEGPQYNYGQPKPMPGGHSGYWTDPRVWEQIEELANTIPPHQKTTPQPQNPPGSTAPSARHAGG